VPDESDRHAGREVEGCCNVKAQSLRTALCLTNPTGMQAGRWRDAATVKWSQPDESEPIIPSLPCQISRPAPLDHRTVRGRARAALCRAAWRICSAGSGAGPGGGDPPGLSTGADRPAPRSVRRGCGPALDRPDGSGRRVLRQPGGRSGGRAGGRSPRAAARPWPERRTDRPGGILRGRRRGAGSRLRRSRTGRPGVVVLHPLRHVAAGRAHVDYPAPAARRGGSRRARGSGAPGPWSPGRAGRRRDPGHGVERWP